MKPELIISIVAVTGGYLTWWLMQLLDIRKEVIAHKIEIAHLKEDIEEMKQDIKDLKNRK